MKTKEAIERVRSRFDKWALDEEDLEAMRALGLVTIESEDEKIRKDIIQFFKDAANSKTRVVRSNTFAEWATYLEKLKEHKHSLDFNAISSWLRDNVHNYINREFNEFHHTVEYDGTINIEKLITDLKAAVDNGAFDVDAAFDTREPRDNWEYIKEFCDKFGRIPKDMDELDALVSYVMDKKQKEQKPVTLDESVELGIDRALCIVKDAKGNLPAYQTDDGIYECDSAIRTLENLLKNGIEQKSAEWSEEEAPDETKQECDSIDIPSSIKTSRIETLKNIISYFKYERKTTQEEIRISFIPCLENLLKDVEHTNISTEWSEEDELMCNAVLNTLERIGDYGTIGMQKDWLKSLPPQLKQEWSEEDNALLKEIVSFFKDGTVKLQHDLDLYAGFLENKFKSLRPQPHWKPSEEQMEALRKVAYKMGNSCFGKDWANDKNLHSLYVALKKL